MGLRNVLIEGVSGAGKTTVAEELQRRGRHVVHGDRRRAQAISAWMRDVKPEAPPYPFQLPAAAEVPRQRSIDVRHPQGQSGDRADTARRLRPFRAR